MNLVVKLLVLVSFIVCIFLYWLVPQTKWMQFIRMNESFFIGAHKISIIYAAACLLLTLGFHRYMIKTDLWLMFIIPYIFLTLYWLISQKTITISNDVIHRKLYRTAKAATIVLIFSLVGMVIILLLYHDKISGGNIWLPFYIFSILIVNSAAALWYFKKF